jgi:hypothetical protein
MRAILSVSDKAGLADFGRGLSALGVELVSTGGTATALAAAGLRVLGVSDVTGFPEMMDGRVKTLHPAIHAGILARRSRPDDLAAIARHGITPVDLVVVNLYPFVKAAQNPETPFDALVEEIDIGGPSLVRAAAKNFRDVLVVVDPEDYARVLEQLGRVGGPELEFRFHLMKKAFEHTGMYDSMIALTLKTVDYAGGAMTRQALPTRHPAPKDLRYGENPHQKAALYGRFRDFFEQLHGKELSYNNILDLTAAASLIAEFPEDTPTLAILKHTNPCGMGQGESLREAWDRAFATDRQAPFGVAEKGLHARPYGAFRLRVSRPIGVRGIGEKSQNAPFTVIGERMQIKQLVIGGSRIDFEIPSVNDHPKRRGYGESNCLDNGMCDVDELDLKGADRNSLAGFNGCQPWLVIQFILLESALDQRQRERRAIYWYVQL